MTNSGDKGDCSQTKKVWEEVVTKNVTYDFLLSHMYAETLVVDPKHLAFTLSRYKFAARMLRDCKKVVDVGCGEGLGELMFVRETKAEVIGIDFDQEQISYASKHVAPHTDGRVSFLCRDLVSAPLEPYAADGLVCMDVIEHVDPSEENAFFKHCLAAVSPDAVAVFGTPNKFAEAYASPRSRDAHVNLFEPDRFVETLRRYFEYVFLFSMNDEVVHTGFYKMAHYLMALGVVVKPQ